MKIQIKSLLHHSHSHITDFTTADLTVRSEVLIQEAQLLHRNRASTMNFFVRWLLSAAAVTKIYVCHV